jgi:hypothetical protein
VCERGKERERRSGSTCIAAGMEGVSVMEKTQEWVRKRMRDRKLVENEAVDLNSTDIHFCLQRLVRSSCLIMYLCISARKNKSESNRKNKK